jgi:hypothetical protein
LDHERLDSDEASPVDDDDDDSSKAVISALLNAVFVGVGAAAVTVGELLQYQVTINSSTNNVVTLLRPLSLQSFSSVVTECFELIQQGFSKQA